MTARKIVVAIMLCGLAAYFVVTWSIGKFRSRTTAEAAPAPQPDPDRIEAARLVTTASLDGASEATAAPWTIAFASSDIPVGAVVAIGEFGADAGALTIRQRGDVVASELRVVAHREDLPERTVAAYVGENADEFALEGVTLFIWAEGSDA